MQTKVARKGVCSLPVETGRFCWLAVELVGVGELRYDVGLRIADGLQCVDGLRIVASLAIKLSQRARNIRVIRSATFSHVQIMTGHIQLFQVLVRNGQQQLRLRGWLDAFCPVQPVKRAGVVSCMHIQITESHQIISAPRCGGNDLLEHAFCFVGTAHQAVGLGQAG